MGKQKRTRDDADRPKRPRKRARAAATSHSLAIANYHTSLKESSRSEELAKGNPVAQFRLKKQAASIESYQDASLLGASIGGGETSKWLIKELKRLRKEGDPQLRLLDVGAINATAYTACDFIEATSIDLNPRSANVIKADFFSYPTPPAGEEFDLVSLSLVLNFVGDLQKRGEMLRLTLEHLKPDGGMLYLVLPLACLTNSRFVDHTRLKGILRAVGYDILKQRDSAKLTYWLCQRSAIESQVKHWAKKPLPGKQTGDRNNFAIVLARG